MRENGIAVRQQDGLRIGFVVADDAGYAFNLSPLLVEDVTEMSRTFNAITLEPGQIAQTLHSLRPSTSANGAGTAASPEPDIGRSPIASTDIDKLQAELAANPAQKFDLARKVNVFNAKVEFVEMSLTGTHVERHTAQLPQDLVFATRDAETQRRVKASFRVVDGDSTLGREAKGIADRVNALRSLYLRSVGSIGSVMLRSKHEPFVKEIEKIRQEIDRFRASAEARLQKEIDKARQKLVDALLPAVMRTPPQDLVTQVSGKPTSEVTRQLGDAASWPPPRSVELAQLLFKAVGRRRGCNRLLHDRQAGSQRCPKRLSRRVQLGHSGERRQPWGDFRRLAVPRRCTRNGASRRTEMGARR